MAEEKRLIDANALIDDTYILDSWDAKIVRAWLDDQPTVDAVEVVRCRKCANTCPGTIGLVCTMWGNRTAPDGFCYMGERKE